ncbi:MAG: glycogen/starch synthase, partial [Candidatus Brocadiales bacterium]
MNIVFVSPEVAPFARTGGLGDVAGSLPKSLKRLGHEVSIFMPLYRHVRHDDFKLSPTGVRPSVPINNKLVTGLVHAAYLPGAEVPVYFIENKDYYDRDELYVDPSVGQGYEDNCKRFTFFSRAVLEAVRSLGIRPDVIHVNDWQSAMIPAYLKAMY